MDVADFKRVAEGQREERREILSRGDIVVRDVDYSLLSKALSYPNVLSILGVRRCGKSVLSWLLLKDKKYGYINFDDESLYGIKASDLDNVLKAFHELYGELDYYVFDEIQNVDGWELFINRMRRTKRVVITGSNSEMLSGELASHLTGRRIDYTLNPFSFREYCEYKKVILEDVEKNAYLTVTAAHMEKTLWEYMQEGGFPEAYLGGPEVVKSIFGDIVLKDISSRHGLRPELSRSLGKYLLTNSTKEISYNKLKEVFSIKRVETMKKYAGYFEDAYLVFFLERFSYKLKQQNIAPKKVYCIDTGLLSAVAFNFSQNKGKLLENTVFLELWRRKNTGGLEVFYWKDAQQKEVDFVIKKTGGPVVELIQACFDVNDEKTLQREINSLLKASEDLRCKNLTILTWDKEETTTIENKKIMFQPAWKWLLKI